MLKAAFGRGRLRAASTAGIEGGGTGGAIPPGIGTGWPRRRLPRIRQVRAWFDPRVPGRIGSGGDRRPWSAVAAADASVPPDHLTRCRNLAVQAGSWLYSGGGGIRTL